MASFLGDLFDSITGQQATPQRTIIPLAEQLAQGGSLLQSQILPQNIAYNQALAPALADIQLGVQNQIFGPAANQLQRGAYQSVLDQLNLGESLSPELTADINRKLLESGAATGFGATPAGTGNIILQTALEGERRGQMRRNEALGAVGQLPVSRYQAPFQDATELISSLGGQVQQQQAAADELANVTEDIRRKNFSALINTGTKIAGTVAGGIFGGPGGAMIGGNIGGSILGSSGVGGMGSPQAQQQNSVASILAGLGFGTQGNYGMGSGGFFGIGANQYDMGADLGVNT